MPALKQSDLSAAGTRQHRGIASEIGDKIATSRDAPLVGSLKNNAHQASAVVQRKPGEDEELPLHRMPIGNPGSTLQAFRPAQTNNTHEGSGKQPFIQTKLSVNTPGDPFEQEADAMADKVMRMKDPFSGLAQSNTFLNSATAPIQRKCAACEEEDKHVHRKEIRSSKTLIQRKCAACEEESHIHRKENSTSKTQGSAELNSYVGSLDSSGHALPESSRQFFEPRFGQDFSNVRIHTGSVAAKSAQSINALAYTTGNNIVFNEGQYSPGSESGQRLMAHELTHVVQQGKSVSRKIIQKAASPDNQLHSPDNQSHSPDNQSHSPDNQLYSLKIGNDSHTNISADEARKLLNDFYHSLLSSSDAGMEAQMVAQKNRSDQYIVGWVSDHVGHVELPPMSMWYDAREPLFYSKAMLNNGNVLKAAVGFGQAEILDRACHRRLNDYIRGTISGAEKSITGLTFVKNSAEAVITATAYATLGPGGAAAVHTVYHAATSAAQQASEVHYGQRDKVDWKGIAADSLIPKDGLAAACKAARLLKKFPSQQGGEWNDATSPGKLPGPLKIYEKKPSIGYGAKTDSTCRGACGEDCKTCKPIEDVPITMRSPDGAIEKWKYKDVVECSTHDGCRQHDAGYDWCKVTTGEKSVLAPCHQTANLECLCNHGASDCVSWIGGGKPSDGTMKFAGSFKKVGDGSVHDLHNTHSLPSLPVKPSSVVPPIKPPHTPKDVPDGRNPLFLEWPKPAAVNYPKLYLTRPGEKRTQEELKELYKNGERFVDNKYAIEEFRPDERKGLPYSSVEIGLIEGNLVDVGFFVGPLMTIGTPGGDKLNNVLKDYGVNPSQLNADHVMEVQLGGFDRLDNLWPLSGAINQRAGAALHNAIVIDSVTGKKFRVSSLKKHMENDPHVHYFFTITKVLT